MYRHLLPMLVRMVLISRCRAGESLPIINSEFEQLAPATGFAEGWTPSFGPGAKARIEMDEAVKHSGNWSTWISRRPASIARPSERFRGLVSPHTRQLARAPRGLRHRQPKYLLYG